GKTLTETPTGTDKQANDQKVNQQVPKTNTEEKVMETNHQGTPQDQGTPQVQNPTQGQDKGNQTNARETTQNTTNVGKKGTEVMPKVRVARLLVRRAAKEAPTAETPAKPTTDKDTVTTGIYNNPQRNTSDWIKMTHGDASGDCTAIGEDSKTYITGYVAANHNSQSIFNVDQIDLNSLEYHLIFHNGDKEVGSGLWFNFADNKTIEIDTRRL